MIFVWNFRVYHISSSVAFSQILMQTDEFLIILPVVHILNIHITKVCLSRCGQNSCCVVSKSNVCIQARCTIHIDQVNDLWIYFSEWSLVDTQKTDFMQGSYILAKWQPCVFPEQKSTRDFHDRSCCLLYCWEGLLWSTVCCQFKRSPKQSSWLSHSPFSTSQYAL